MEVFVDNTSPGKSQLGDDKDIDRMHLRSCRQSEEYLVESLFASASAQPPHHPSLISADGSHFGPHVINWYLIYIWHWVKTSFGVQMYLLN